MVLANITDYSVGLFIHVLAVVVAFGPTFGYGILFSLLPKYPRAAPALFEATRKVDRYLVEPGDDRAPARRHLPARRRALEVERSVLHVGFIAIIALFGIQHGFFRPQGRKAAGARRTRPRGRRHAQRRVRSEVAKRLGMVGPAAGLIVVVTIFFMVFKP